MVPDLAGWRRERMAHVENVAFFTLAPDWVCEALSPSTEKLDRVEKLPRYAAAGVGHAWLVSAERRTLEVMRLHEGRRLAIDVFHDDEIVRAEPFDAIALDLSILWADLPPTPPTRVAEPPATYAP
jgi:Uma2 family endonuclease